MITKDSIIDIFSEIKKTGKWDVSKPLLYGYFFIDKDIQKLNKAKSELEKLGYAYVDIFKADTDDLNSDTYFYLHVQKKEIHTIESLDKRNSELYLFATNHHLDSYDGFDIGEI